MADFVQNYYLWIKSLHVIAIIAWMAGLLYLPRIFVYHTDVKNKVDGEIFKKMEYRLMMFIIKPAFIVALITGCLISYYIYNMQGAWLHWKYFFVLLLIIYNIFLIYAVKNFKNDVNKISAKTWRLLNEIPTILMIIIVILVVVKPIL